MQRTILGPFIQLLTMDDLPARGALRDEQLNIVENAGVEIEGGMIKSVGLWNEMVGIDDRAEIPSEPLVGLPGFIDSHTHICFAGSRHRDYASRNAGATYLEIAAAGGGIWDTVLKTRKANPETLYEKAHSRLDKMLENGVTTAEVKSGYGLSVDQEIKQLEIIGKLAESHRVTVIATCLAAHMKPSDFSGGNSEYLQLINKELLPQLKELTNRVDIFVEESAFSVAEARKYLREAKQLGFELTVHGDQFSTGGSSLAIEMEAKSVDHLEASDGHAIRLLAHSKTVATVLPGASLGLGIPYAPARQLLDAGAIVNIASDWNPGSAPMGNLLTQAALMGAAEKLTNAEVFAGLTIRAAQALNLHDRGVIRPGMKADIIAFPASDYREILYHQGELKPTHVWKTGKAV